MIQTGMLTVARVRKDKNALDTPKWVEGIPLVGTWVKNAREKNILVKVNGDYIEVPKVFRVPKMPKVRSA